MDGDNKDWYQIKAKFTDHLIDSTGPVPYEILAVTDDYNRGFIVLLW